jgi:hypothetical protein
MDRHERENMAAEGSVSANLLKACDAPYARPYGQSGTVSANQVSGDFTTL